MITSFPTVGETHNVYLPNHGHPDPEIHAWKSCQELKMNSGYWFSSTATPCGRWQWPGGSQNNVSSLEGIFAISVTYKYFPDIIILLAFFSGVVSTKYTKLWKIKLSKCGSCCSLKRGTMDLIRKPTETTHRGHRNSQSLNQ